MLQTSFTTPSGLCLCLLALAQIIAPTQAAPIESATSLDEVRSNTTVQEIEATTAMAILRRLLFIDAEVFLRMNEQAKRILQNLEQLTGLVGQDSLTITPTASQHIGVMLLSAAFICSTALTFLVLCDCAYRRQHLNHERRKAEKEVWS